MLAQRKDLSAGPTVLMQDFLAGLLTAKPTVES